MNGSGDSTARAARDMVSQDLVRVNFGFATGFDILCSRSALEEINPSEHHARDGTSL
jgi:hypothetical protein